MFYHIILVFQLFDYKKELESQKVSDEIRNIRIANKKLNLILTEVFGTLTITQPLETKKRAPRINEKDIYEND